MLSVCVCVSGRGWATAVDMESKPYFRLGDKIWIMWRMLVRSKRVHTPLARIRFVSMNWTFAIIVNDQLIRRIAVSPTCSTHRRTSIMHIDFESI